MFNSSTPFKCPIDKVVGLFSKKWTIQLIRDMFFGKKQFKEFQEDKPDLSNKVLSERLKELEEKGIIEKKLINMNPVRTEYYLTEYGHNLNKIIYEIAMFSLNSGFDEYSNPNTKEEIEAIFKDRLGLN